MSALKSILLTALGLALTGPMCLAAPPDAGAVHPQLTAEKLGSLLRARPDADTLERWLRDYNYLAESDGHGRFRKVIVSGSRETGPAKPVPASSHLTASRSTGAIALPRQTLQKQARGRSIRLNLPDGQEIRLVRDQRVRTDDGVTTWTGHLAGSPQHRSVFSFDRYGVDGQIITPGASYRVETRTGTTQLVDPVAAGLQPPPPNPAEPHTVSGTEPTEPVAPENPAPPPLREPSLQADVVPYTPQPLPASPLKLSRKQKNLPGALLSETAYTRRATLSPGGLVVVDILVAYTKSLSESSIQRKLRFLIALANQAFLDSRIDVSLRLAGTRRVDYPDDSDNSRALEELTRSQGTLQPLEALRQANAADAVILLRNFVAETQGGCGSAWVNGADQSPMTPERAFAVVSLGSGDGQYCSNYALAHEIGHILGGTHDAEHAGSAGRFPYSYGYGVEGRFGDIMSYYSPEIGLFSNPELTLCDNTACGIADQADLSRTFNATARIVSGFAVAE